MTCHAPSSAVAWMHHSARVAALSHSCDRLLPPAHHVFHSQAGLADALPRPHSAPASIDPTTNDCCCATNKLYPELRKRCGRLWLPSTSSSVSRRCREGGGRRLHDEAVVARFRRVVCGARHARRWWGQKLWMFEASWGSSSGSRGLSWRFGAESGGEETHRCGAGVMDGLGAF